MPNLNETSFVSMDLETTGFRPPWARIVEIGAVRFQGDRVVEQFQMLVNPECGIPPDATRVHGISDGMVRGQPTIREALPEFLAFAGASPLIIHNASFDLRFLCHDMAHCGFGDWSAPVVDTLRLARRTFPRLGGHSLDALVRCLRIPETNAHRALADSLCAMHVFRHCVRRQYGDQPCDAADFLAEHGVPWRHVGRGLTE